MVKLIDPLGNVVYETENEQAARLDCEIKGAGWTIEKIAPPELEKTLGQLKTEKINEINQAQRQELETFTYNGKEFQTRESDKVNILGKALGIQISPVDSVIWIAADNTYVTFTGQEFLNFAKAVEAHCEALIFKGRQLKNAAADAATKEELDLIQWD